MLQTLLAAAPVVFAELPIGDENKFKAYLGGVAALVVMAAGVGIIATYKRARTSEVARNIMIVFAGAIVFSLGTGIVAFGDKLKGALGL